LWNCQRPSAFSRLALVTERMIVPIHDSRSVTTLVEQFIGAKESDAKREIGAYYWTHALSFRLPIVYSAGIEELTAAGFAPVFFAAVPVESDPVAYTVYEVFLKSTPQGRDSVLQ